MMHRTESMLDNTLFHELNSECREFCQPNTSSSSLPKHAQHRNSKLTKQTGFTLIEVMLVVVIAGIFAAMIGLTIGGSDTRRVLQEREQLIDSIAEIRLESDDQNRMLGLIPLDQTATDPARYVVVEYDPSATDKDKLWKPAIDFKVHALPTNVELTVTPLQANNQNPSAHLNDITSGDLSPKLIWFGNGEATPVRLQLSQDGQNIGDAVEITALGKVKKDQSDTTRSQGGQ
jgi:general secretion pathway protein G